MAVSSIDEEQAPTERIITRDKGSTDQSLRAGRPVVCLVENTVDLAYLDEIIQQEGCYSAYLGSDISRAIESLTADAILLFDIESATEITDDKRQLMQDRSASIHIVSSAANGELQGDNNPFANPADLVALLQGKTTAVSNELFFSFSNHSALNIAFNRHAIISSTDASGTINFVNDNFCKVSGYQRSELMGSNHRIINSGRHKPAFFELMWRTIRAGETWHGIVCNKSSTGSFYWVEATVVPQWDSVGNIIGYVSIRTDITSIVNQRIQEKKARNRAENFQQSIQRLLEGMRNSDSSFEEKLNNLCVSVKQSIEADQVFVGELREVEGRFDVVASADGECKEGGSVEVDKAQLNFLKLSKNKSTIELYDNSNNSLGTIWSICSRDEVVKSAMYINIPVKDNVVFLFLVNVKFEKNYNRSELAFFSSASNFVARHYEQEYLKRAKEEAERSNLAKSNFLSNISHELRTPLHAIIGFGELLLNSSGLNASQDDIDGIKNIISAGEHLHFLINDLLDLAAIEANKMHVDFTRFDPVNLVNGCLSFVRQGANEKSIVIRFENKLEDGVLIYADNKRCQQVLLNLLTNAIKYSDSHSNVSIRVFQNDDRVRIEVEDQGYGIARKQQEKLFVPFDRLGQEAGNIQGAGIGLIIARQLTELMSGEMGFTSEEGLGSLFWFELPAVYSVEQESATGEEEVLGASTMSTQRNCQHTYQVLCVEDNPVNQLLLRGLFKKHKNIEVSYFDLPGEAIERVKKVHFDLLLLDINLPEMDGVELLKKIRNVEGYETVPALALTADANFQRKVGETDFYDCLIKPFSAQSFYPMVNGCLEAS